MKTKAKANQNWVPIAILLAMIAGVGAILLFLVTSQPSGPTRSVETVGLALAKCDQLASTPGDRQRKLAPVTDDQFAPGPAVEACEAAVAENPEEPRAIFQLGRALMLSGRDEEAWERLKEARLAHYAMASLYLGNVYRDGLLGQSPNFLTASTLYQEARDAGIADAGRLYNDIQAELLRDIFDKSLFQNGDYMERLYNGDYDKLDFPLSMAYYVKGIAVGIEDNNTIFQDQACASLFSSTGLMVIKNSEFIAAGDVIRQSKDFSDFLDRAAKGVGSYALRETLIDQGKRDSTVLYNDAQGRYGCKSTVTKQIFANMMVMVRNQNGLVVETPMDTPNAM